MGSLSMGSTRRRVSCGWARVASGLGAAALVFAWGAGAAAQGPVDLIPDITLREDLLYDNDIVSYIIPGHKHIRLSNGTPNIGDGKLYMYGGEDLGNGKQRVYQRIYRSDGTFWDREAGQFVYHPTHNHIHVESWCVYRVREILPGDGVGAILAEGEKTSFCLLDLGVHDPSLPNFNPAGQFFACASTVQGISVGWYDVYSKSLDGQWVDITGIPPGEYWLESEVDPEGHVLELDETNNVKRVKVTIPVFGGGTIDPDPYEPNNGFAQVLSRAPGAETSPNLGPCGPQRVIGGLTMTANDTDLFRFYMPAAGTMDDLVQIDFDNNEADLGLRLLSDTGALLVTSNTFQDRERIFLNGRPAGWYYAMVSVAAGQRSPAYTLTIDPSVNGAPGVTLVKPPAGDTELVHGSDAYVAEWTSSDPENNARWVTLYMNHEPAFDGHEVILPTTLHTDAALGQAVINSAYVHPGTYWVYAEITDGGSVRGSWSAGTLTFKERCPGDLTGDGVSDILDFLAFIGAYSACEGSTEHCEFDGVHADFNEDGLVDVLDVLDFIDAMARPCE